MESIGNKIIKYRREQNMTQEKLAEKVGVDNKTISRWERGENTPSPELLKKLANALNVKVSNLIDDHEISQAKNKKKMTEKTKKIIRNTIAIFLLLSILVASNMYTYACTKKYYDLYYYTLVPDNPDVLVSGNLMRNEGMSTIFIDHINYSDKENPMGTIGAIKTNHVVVELLSNSKFMASEVIESDQKEYLYKLLEDVRMYFSIRDDAEEDYKDFDYKNMTIRISYGENKMIETNLVLKEI